MKFKKSVVKFSNQNKELKKLVKSVFKRKGKKRSKRVKKRGRPSVKKNWIRL